MATDRESLIQRIKKLKAHAESAEKIGSLEEAKVFMAKVQELMIEHNLSMMEIDSAKEDEEVLKGFSYVEAVSYADGTYYNCRKMLIKVLAQYNFCQIVIDKQRKEFTVYGNGINVDNVVWMYWYMAIRMKSLALEAYREHRNENRFKFISDYMLGAVQGIREALEEERTKHNNVTALVLYNDKMVEKYMEQLGVTYVVKRSKVRTDFGIGAALGFQAGKNLQYQSRKLGK